MIETKLETYVFAVTVRATFHGVTEDWNEVEFVTESVVPTQVGVRAASKEVARKRLEELLAQIQATEAAGGGPGLYLFEYETGIQDVEIKEKEDE